MLNLSARPTEPCKVPEALVRALGRHPLEVRRARAYLAVLASEDEVRDLQPDLEAVAELDAAGLIVTAPGLTVDFVSRYFAPRLGVPEDPVTGSAHCALIPYWAERLSRTHLEARQLSARGGELRCELRGDRVRIGGQAVSYLDGVIEIEG
jgi:predicted PhzF superfamily epimerase YddE/YHI9